MMKTKRKIPLKPKRLMQGDAVGIVAPASHFDHDMFRQGLAVLASMGFEPVFDDGIFEKSGSFSGADTHRAGQINRFFADPAIDAVLCARGGYGALRILPLLDVDTIRKNPKSLIGFSDITALHAAVSSACGLVTFHGPTVTTLANATTATRHSFYSVLTSGEPPVIKPINGHALCPGAATGPVAGGNLTTLCHLVGTPFQPDFRGRIVLLEDIGEAPYRIDRMLTHMKLAGCFTDISGILLGNFRSCGKVKEIERICIDIFKGCDIPILAGFTIGHQRRNLTIPLGISATLDTDRKMLAFHEPATR
jgi:muramoyltetrapeptide carboxypeptidase